MNLENLKNKKVLLFGKSRAFSEDELVMQLKSHQSELVKEYEEGVDFIVDGAMMSPVQTIESEKLYEQKKAEFLNIEELENLLTNSIDEDVLMMSLKLSADKQRLKEFLMNPQINDEFYFKLLSMYDWGDEDFYENDDNRDISASLIRRFYKNIERNHNVEFSKLGLMHLVLQSDNAQVIETIAKLKPLRKSFKLNEKDQGFKIITSIATHYATPKSVLKLLIKESNTYVRTLIAMRKHIDSEIQNILYESGEKEILESLSFCKDLSEEIYKKLCDDESYAKNIAKYIKLDYKKYEFLKDKYMSELALNETLDLKMQHELLDSHKNNIDENLAHNKNISQEMVPELLKQHNKKVDFALYSNPSTSISFLRDGYKDPNNHLALSLNTNTPKDILSEIYNIASNEMKEALAKNTSTPIEILYQLQLDSKYEHYVKENPSFGKHIQQENIGWQV